MLYDLEHGTLQVKLPHLQLVFYLTRGKAEIFSRQFRGMQISEDQSIGTLLGLKSKLMLHDTHDPQKSAHTAKSNFEQDLSHSIVFQIPVATSSSLHALQHRNGTQVGENRRQVVILIEPLQ